MSSTSQPNLQACLQEEISAMTQLFDALKSEQAALVDGNVGDLTVITQNKGRLIAFIAALEDTRNKQLAILGFTEDIEGLQTYLQSSDDVAVSNAWNELRDISQVAKEANRTNGLLINRHLARNHGALSALQQNNQSLYGPSGQSTVKSSSGRGFVVG